MHIRGLNKRGDIRTLAPTELVGYILGGLVLVLIIIVAGVFTAFYFNEKDEEFAVNNFIALANKLEGISKSQLQFEVQRAFPFYIPSDYIIVGFNKGWSDSKVSDGCQPEEVRKPDQRDGKEGEKCINSACICLFGDSNDNFMNSDGTYNVNLVQCQSIPESDYISTLHLTDAKTYNYPKEVYYNVVGQNNGLTDYSKISFSDYAFFYLYGQCDGYWFDKDTGSRKLYIEKFTDSQNKNYIFIAPEGSPAIDERYTKMNEKYGKLAKSEYLKIIDNVLEKEASTGTGYEIRLDAINSFVNLFAYYGFVDELRPRLMKIAALYLRHSKEFKPKLDPIIQSMGILKSSSSGDEKLQSQFFLSRLQYMKSTAQNSRIALLEMQNLIDSNAETYKKYLTSSTDDLSPCGSYYQSIRQDKKDNSLLFHCSKQLLNSTYDITHILVYAGEGEEFRIDNYKIKVKKVKLAEEATISIYKYNELKKDYDLVKCDKKDELTITIGAIYYGADEYNPEIENQGHTYSLNSILQKCAKT